MNYKLLTSTIVVLTTLSVSAQNINDNNIYYSRYEGAIDSNTKVTANIVRSFDKLHGNYNYQMIDDIHNLVPVNTITVTGDIIDNQARIKEYGNETHTFVGLITKESFTGIWNSTTHNVLQVDISENYPMGAIPFDVHYLHSEDKLYYDSSNSPIAEIELTLLYPIKQEQNNISDSIKRIISDSFFGANFFENNPDSMLTSFEDEYYTNYKNQNAGRSSIGASNNWQKTVSMSVIHNSDYLVCLEYLVYAYSGGAHGMTKVSYSNVDLHDGKLLTYEDIFKENTRDSLSKILTQKLYHDKKIPTHISLVDAGYFVDKIEPNHNLYIENNGIGFLYNSYEIAPYSFGQTSIFIEFELIKDYISDESPIKKSIIKKAL